MKKLYVVAGLVIMAMLLQSGVTFHTIPPAGRTGATGVYCNSCHGGAAANPINTGGGNITVTGLPSAGGYIPGQSYPFSVTITHGTADRLRWGFSIAARSSSGAAVGTFSTTNPYAAINTNTNVTTQELSHFNTIIEAASNTYTFSNLTWTAPSTNLPPDGNVTFFYVGNATNGNSASTGDFIYAGSSSAVLPIHLTDFTARVLVNQFVELKWKTASEENSDHFYIEKSDDGQLFYRIGRIPAAVHTTTGRSYSYIDKSVSSYNRPVFYRLKLVDKDGTYKQSKAVSVQLKNGSLFVQNIHPMVVRSNSTVTAYVVSDKSRPVHIDIVDITGRLLKTYNEQLTQGNNLVDIKLPSGLSSDWIFVRFTSPGFKQVVPLVVNQ